ncbi:BRRG2, Response regulator [Sclerotinia borealis F-4128]|uniref:Transcription factor n=1 Tax=Sclerotinia borealis (strain F-4128) TaxID=1432307 RepID=W9CLZ5_SCLBF|nr:BRRG2, Response regulator [Sclerotinia borealis F-4128]
MEKGGGDMAGPSANNSSDFVRKLYKMLEDPSYESIVRWGEGGESFVVLENEKFTKQILPKHFKHSNFASFVRQLNKYDFHKVRQNNEDNTQSPYGQNAWEFKHPEFQANKKDSLDNIRRKAPAPRKAAQSIEETYPAIAQQQMDLFTTQLVATQQQLQGLSRSYQDLTQLNLMLIQQVVDGQKFAKNHEAVMRSLVGYLLSDTQRQNGRAVGLSNGTAPSMLGRPTGDIHPSTPLLQAQNLLGQLSAENYPSKELEQVIHDYRLRTDYTTPPNDPGGLISMPPISESLTAPAGYSADKSDIDNLVYPVGAIVGIDPIDQQHVNNIPYALPPPGSMPRDSMPPAELMPQPSRTPGPRKGGSVSIWGDRKPRILLVEDDQVCARIGTKFLESFECGVDIARDGLEAVSKINLGEENHFDLILMDIIMPHLDGVSATVCIREMRANLPIIAMTSNIRTDDIEMYFRYGMNDVLPKPFTKEGMMKALEKHLGHFRKKAPTIGDFSSPRQMSHPGGFITPAPSHPPLGLNMGQLTAAQSIVDDAAAGKSPQTATSWQSPIQLPGGSPVVTSAPGSYMQPTMQPNGMRDPSYSVTPTHPHPQSNFPQPPSGLGNQRPPHRRGISEMSGASTPDGNTDQKRQRMYAPPGNF